MRQTSHNPRADCRHFSSRATAAIGAESGRCSRAAGSREAALARRGGEALSSPFGLPPAEVGDGAGGQLLAAMAFYRAWLALILRWLRALLSSPSSQASTRSPVVCEGERIPLLVLDGCNLPLSLRGGSQQEARLISRSEGSEEDWSSLLGAVAGAFPRPFQSARVLFDGHSGSGRLLGDSTRSLGTAVDTYATEQGRTADDVLVELVARRSVGGAAEEEQTTASAALVVLRSAGSGESSRLDLREQASGDATRMPSPGSATDWFVVRRVGGGERAYARLWRRLGLTRTEGVRSPLCAHNLFGDALAGRTGHVRVLHPSPCASWLLPPSLPLLCAAACASLLPLTKSLRAQACLDAQELGAGASRFVAVHSRKRERLRTVVATDDVLLAKRVVDAGGAALTWRQLRVLCGASSPASRAR